MQKDILTIDYGADLICSRPLNPLHGFMVLIVFSIETRIQIGTFL